MLNAAERAVDAAVEAGKILPAQKDYHLASIKSHADGIEKGVDAFNSFVETARGAANTNTDVLIQRVGPTGTPPSGAGQRDAPAYLAPNGWQPPSEERLELQTQIAEYAQKRGIPYRHRHGGRRPHPGAHQLRRAGRCAERYRCGAVSPRQQHRSRAGVLRGPPVVATEGDLPSAAAAVASTYLVLNYNSTDQPVLALLAGGAWRYLYVPDNFPRAATDLSGVVELATSAEAAAGTDSTRAVTPAGIRGRVKSVQVSRTVSGSGSVVVDASLSASISSAGRLTLTLAITKGSGSSPSPSPSPDPPGGP